ncbi:MAG: J domain-containing protein [Candidatus Kapaibacterium sp.]
MSFWQIFSRVSRLATTSSIFDGDRSHSGELRRAQELIDQARRDDAKAAAAAFEKPAAAANNAMNHIRACEILGVARAATLLEVAQAYRKIIVIHHPDHAVKSTPEEQCTARIRTQEINEAYTFLKMKLGMR